VGEAKRRTQEMKKMYLANLSNWLFEPTEWEKKTVSEIEQLPIVQVRRYPDDALKWMKMPPQQCHENAAFMQKNDPGKSVSHITGWWIQSDCYVLHSVILREDQYSCVTPAPYETTNIFDFVPDSKIVWREDGLVRSAFRDNVMIGKGVRKNPVEHLATTRAIRQRLLSEMNLKMT
jgi:hypothetical protein